MKIDYVKKRGKDYVRITMGGKSKPIKRAERRIAKRQQEIRNHFRKEEEKQ